MAFMKSFIIERPIAYTENYKIVPREDVLLYFSAHVHSLPDSRYIRRILNWKPHGKGQAGMQRSTRQQ